MLFGFFSVGMDTEAQAIGRAARLGQKRLVTVTRFIMEGTVEEDLHRRNDEARSRAHAVSERQAMDGQKRPEGERDLSGVRIRTGLERGSGSKRVVDPQERLEGEGSLRAEDRTGPSVGVVEEERGTGSKAGGGAGLEIARGKAEGNSQTGVGQAGECPQGVEDGGLERAVFGESVQGTGLGKGNERVLAVRGEQGLTNGGRSDFSAAIAEGLKRAGQGLGTAHVTETLQDIADGQATTSDHLMAEIAPRQPLIGSDERGTPGLSFESAQAEQLNGVADIGIGPSQVSGASGENGSQMGGVTEGEIDPPGADSSERGASQTGSVVLQEVPQSQDADTVLGGADSSLDRGLGIEPEHGERSLERGAVGDVGMQAAKLGVDPILNGVEMEAEEPEVDYCPLGCGTVFERGMENTLINEHIDMCLNQETLTQMAASGSYQ
jgi:hypothetical protein